jgi:DNA-binding transcriptional ArsR family regulator
VQLDVAFAALADPTRRELLLKLEAGEQTMSALASPLPITLMAVQKHVRILENAKLVSTRKVGRSRRVRLLREGLRVPTDWLQRAEARWNAALDRLEKALEESPT